MLVSLKSDCDYRKTKAQFITVQVSSHGDFNLPLANKFPSTLSLNGSSALILQHICYSAHITQA